MGAWARSGSDSEPPQQHGLDASGPRAERPSRKRAAAASMASRAWAAASDASIASRARRVCSSRCRAAPCSCSRRTISARQRSRAASMATESMPVNAARRPPLAGRGLGQLLALGGEPGLELALAPGPVLHLGDLHRVRHPGRCTEPGQNLGLRRTAQPPACRWTPRPGLVAGQASRCCSCSREAARRQPQAA